jgi:type II secretory pathway component PulJ
VSARRGAGFTLFEVLGVVLVTTILLSATISFYINLSQQAARASENTREVRRAAALLDRIAADLEHTLLVRKPAEADALASPWLFVGEGRFGQPGADQLKFIRREIPRASEGPASDLAMVAYTLQRSADGPTFELRRWSTPELPESLDREFPPDDDPDSLLLTDGISYFTVRFLDEQGEWVDRWDSTQLVESSELPLAVEIEVGLASATDPDAEKNPDEVSMRYTRQVELPLRPLDLEELLKPGEEGDAGEDEDEDGENGDLTLADCIDFSKVGSGSIPGLSATDISTLSALAQQNPDAPFAPYAGALAGHPAVNAKCR